MSPIATQMTGRRAGSSGRLPNGAAFFPTERAVLPDGAADCPMEEDFCREY